MKSEGNAKKERRTILQNNDYREYFFNNFATKKSDRLNFYTPEKKRFMIGKEQKEQYKRNNAWKVPI